MKILGIDPGSRLIGHALIEMKGGRIEYIQSKTQSFSQIDDFPTRIRAIYVHTKNLITEWRPDHVSIEGLIYVKSPTALIKLAQARGAILAALPEMYTERIFEYSPNLVKLTTSGHGHATKENVQLILGRMLGQREFATMDESDALAIAVCHALHLGPMGQLMVQKSGRGKSGKNNLAASVQHMIKEKNL